MTHIELYARMHFAMHKLKLPEHLAQLVLDRYVHSAGPPSLQQLRRTAPKSGQLIRHYFTEWGLKAEAIAEIMGCSLQNVYNYTSKPLKPYYNPYLEGVELYAVDNSGKGVELVASPGILYD